MPSSVPVSVMLSKELRAKLQRQAEKRALGLSTTMRTLLEERLRELEEDEGLSRAMLWQRAQAWATWERYQRGEEPEVSWDEVMAVFDEAPAPKPKSRSASRARSVATSKRKSRG